MPAKQQSSRLWFLPSLIFGGIAVLMFSEMANAPRESGGGPAMIDFGPLFSVLFALAFLGAAFATFVSGARDRKRYLAEQATKPEFPVATARRR